MPLMELCSERLSGDWHVEKISPTRIAVDETAFKKRHDYVTVLSDKDAGTVPHVGSRRKKATLKAWYESLTE